MLSRRSIERAYIRDVGVMGVETAMKVCTEFNNVPDLALIEILSYLSSTDALCAFTCLNDRWTRLIAERGFFRQVNLSPTYYRQFRQLLQILPLDDIETLVIDRTASPLQLIRWPYLPRLTRLHLRGVREYDSILFFALIHVATLTHITIESDEYSLTVSDWSHSLVPRSMHFSLFIVANRMEYLQDGFIQGILCFHSFRMFFFTIYLIFAHLTWASNPVISSWSGTSHPFEHLSLIYASQFWMLKIYLL